jgi:hypothetical protein
MRPGPVLYLAACVALPLALLTYGVGGMDMTASGRILVQESQREAALVRRNEVVWRCTQGKQRIAAEVIAGRLSLCEAADGFRELNTLLDDGNDDLLGTYQRPAGEEDLWRNVIVWVRGEVRRDPARGPAVLSRLEKEFQEHFGHSPLPLSP